MPLLNELMKTWWPMLLSGIVVVLVLYGCSTPLVDVKVVTCGQDTTSDDGKGQCTPETITAGMGTVQPAVCKQNNQTVPCGSNTCAVGTTRCKPSNPGAGCPRTKLCKTMLQLPGSTCYCDCNY